jgi:hypothetical protein
VLNVIFNNGAKIGVRKFYHNDLHTLYREGQYATDITNRRLYLYCEGTSPDKKYHTINMTRCFYGEYINIGARNSIIDNINFLGFGGGGIRGSFECPDNTTQNCEISFSGGMLHPIEIVTAPNGKTAHDKKYGLRYGNGIETWENSNNFIIDHNWIYHTFDSAVSPQGDGDSSGNYIGFQIVNNIFEYNNADVEYFDDAQSPPDTDPKIADETILMNVDISENIFRFTSFGWGTRESDKIRGIQGVLRMDLRKDEVIDIDFTNNLIDTPGMEIFTIKNYNLANNTTSDFIDGVEYPKKPFYKFGKIFAKCTNTTNSAEYNKLNNADSLLSGNRYYYNYYVRNYPYVSTGYMIDGETYTEQANRKADSDAELYQSLHKVDDSLTAKFFWYSTEVTEE